MTGNAQKGADALKQDKDFNRKVAGTSSQGQIEEIMSFCPGLTGLINLLTSSHKKLYMV